MYIVSSSYGVCVVLSNCESYPEKKEDFDMYTRIPSTKKSAPFRNKKQTTTVSQLIFAE